MTAQPLSSALAKVRKLLPVSLFDNREADGSIFILDKWDCAFCIVPPSEHDDAMARAELIRDAMNGMM